jgi:hypothetical protein
MLVYLPRDLIRAHRSWNLIENRASFLPLRVVTPYILYITCKVIIHAKTAGSMRAWHALDTESHAITNTEAVQSYSSSSSPPGCNLGYDEGGCLSHIRQPYSFGAIFGPWRLAIATPLAH